jgi:hypothetical protein
MSNWTRVLLAVSFLEETGPEDGPECYVAIDHINAWLAGHYSLLFQIKNPDPTLHEPHGMFAAYCKGLDWEGFTKVVANAPWNWKDQVQLFLEQEDDKGFQKIDLNRS